MSALPTVALAGASGRLGAAIASTCLQPVPRGRFADVIILSRRTPPEAQDLVRAGATLHRYSEESLVEEALKGVDVLVNAHGEWEAKKRNFRLTTHLNPDMRGYEAGGKFNPTFILHQHARRGTDRGDTCLASPPAAVPPELCLSGDRTSVSEIARIMVEHGARRVDVTSIPLHPFQAQISDDPPSFAGGIGYLKISHGRRKHRSQQQEPGTIEAFGPKADRAKET